jgi:zinc/manganese transport system substrate-binding protein
VKDLIMLTRRTALFLLAGSLALGSSLMPAMAQAPETMKVVATFSILADIVRNVGGDRVEVTELVGPNGDAHVYSPTPADARRLADAKVVFTNGLKFEGWIDRLVKSSGTKATIIETSKGVKVLDSESVAGHGHGHSHGKFDPHAWQSALNIKSYADNIRKALTAADPAGQAVYEANTAAYVSKLEELDVEIRKLIETIPQERRKIITSHDAFVYFEAAYGIEFVSPQGVSTEAEASAKDVAKIIQQIRREKITAVFVENVSDTRLMERIAKETGAKIGGKVYSDALSEPGGPAGTYIDMMRHNIRAFSAAMSS